MLSHILDPRGIVRVQSWDDATAIPTATAQFVNAEWPREVGTVANGLVDILCIGPTDWLLISGVPDGNQLCKQLAATLVGSSLRATDLSQGLIRIECEGPDVRESLLEGCSLDLHPDRFRPGQCARTRFAGVPTVLYCRAPSRFEGIVAASYREYLLAWTADS